MSVITLADAKAYLDVIHSADDDKLQSMLDGAEAEALNFMDRDQFGELCPCDSNFESESQSLLPDVRTGVLILLQASYQASPGDALQLRRVAEIKLMPYRCNLGV
ncbi:MAG: head-tail connector protein [Alcanivoracaceae bacterium]|nr:head-tail connector protein [Alcanivoracaceae bacterium]